MDWQKARSIVNIRKFNLCSQGVCTIHQEPGMQSSIMYNSVNVEIHNAYSSTAEGAPMSARGRRKKPQRTIGDKTERTDGNSSDSLGRGIPDTEASENITQLRTYRESNIAERTVKGRQVGNEAY